MQTSITISKILTQSDFDCFATLSGDFNPIHVDPDFAAQSRFKKPVAHGALLVTILRGLTEQLVPGSTQISHAVKFTAPTYAEEVIEFSAKIMGQDNDTYHIALQVRSLETDTITCQGEASLKLKKA